MVHGLCFLCVVEIFITLNWNAHCVCVGESILSLCLVYVHLVFSLKVVHMWFCFIIAHTRHLDFQQRVSLSKMLVEIPKIE